MSSVSTRGRAPRRTVAVAAVTVALVAVVSLDAAAAAGWRHPNGSRGVATLRVAPPPATTPTSVAAIPTPTPTPTHRPTIKPSPKPSAKPVLHVVTARPTPTPTPTPTHTVAVAHAFVVNHFTGSIQISLGGNPYVTVPAGARRGPFAVVPAPHGNDVIAVRDTAHPTCGEAHVDPYFHVGQTITVTVSVSKGGQCILDGKSVDAPTYSVPGHVN